MKRILFLTLIFVLLASCSGKNETISDNDIPDIPTDDSDTASVDDTDSAPVDDADSQPEPNDDDADSEPTDDADSMPEPNDDDADSEPTDDADSTPEPNDDDVDTEPTDDADSIPEPNDDDVDTEPTDDADSQPEPSDDDVDIDSDDDTDTTPEVNDDDADSEPFNACSGEPCAGITNSTGVCIAGAAWEYSCECNEHYTWNGIDCEADSRDMECSGLPEHGDWNSVSVITQTWNGNDWSPSSEAVYDETVSTIECRFRCKGGYVWKDQKCLVPKVFGRICTGQKECFDNNFPISCPEAGQDFFGQDPQYARLGYCFPQSFSIKETIPGEETVVDNNLGLEWMKTIPKGTSTWEEAENYCSELNFGGHDDWRLPTQRELLSIVDISRRLPAMNTFYFQKNPLNTPEPSSANIFWSSNLSGRSYYGDPDPAPERFMLVDFRLGRSFPDTKDSYYSVRCVRGETLPYSDFTKLTVNGKEIVSDRTTGLMWYNPSVTSSTSDWKKTLSTCEKSNYAGYTDWRLPNRNELASIFNNNSESASDFPDLPQNQNPKLLASSSSWFGLVTCNTINYAELDFDSSTNVRILCVRSEQISDPCENNICGETGFLTGSCIVENATEYSCGCIEGFFWNGESCIDPCEDNTCGETPHSTHTCTPLSKDEYSCGCEPGYFWTPLEKSCIRPRPYGNICTGIDKCIDSENNENSCPLPGENLFGQDPQYAEAGMCHPLAFALDSTVPEEKTVFDYNTGLEWQQKISGKRTWTEAWTYCNELNYGGHDDWRRPTIKELFTIANYDASSSASTLYLKRYLSSGVALWSDNQSIINSMDAWTLDSNSLPYVTTFREKNAAVRCVRGAFTPENSFVTSTADNGDVIVTDIQTGLMWQKTVNDNDNSFESALSYCENLDYAGYDDWRLPNIKELLSLADYSRKQPASTFPDMGSEGMYQNIFISSSVSYGNKCIVDFYSGAFYCGNLLTSYAKKVRCVRSDKNPCSSNPCAEVENSTGLCTQDGISTYTCGCASGYIWNSSTRTCDKITECTGLPAHASWNSVPVITQRWNGTDWEPSSTGSHNVSESTTECRFKCDEGYDWNGSECITLEIESDGLIWSKLHTYIDVYSSVNIQDRAVTREMADSYCGGLTEGGYSKWSLPSVLQLRTLIINCPMLAVGGECALNCRNATDYFWSKEYCTISWQSGNYSYDYCQKCSAEEGPFSKLGDTLSLMSSSFGSYSYSYSLSFTVAFNPAEIIKSSSGLSSAIRCVRQKCAEGYLYDGKECVEDPCSNNPCSKIENSNGVCTAADEKNVYSCGCSEGYAWDGSRCLKECNGTLEQWQICIDKASGLEWYYHGKKNDLPVSPCDPRMVTQNTQKNLYHDWHLPTVSELRTLIQNCPPVETGGSCGLTETCLSDECNSVACNGCSPNSSGLYSKIGIAASFWSSNESSDPDKVWRVNFLNGSIKEGYKSAWDSVLCVRKTH